MTIVVGYAPDGRGRAVLHLAAVLARSSGDDLLLCAVVPQPWPPSPARVDAEYQAHLDATAGDALEQARARLPADLSTALLVHHARSVPAGIIEVAEQHDAPVIVVGSSAEGGAGYVSLGSASSRLLHSSPIPVALAPRGFRARSEERLRRVTAAFGGAPGGDDLVVAATAVAGRLGATLRLASFAVRARAPITAGVGRGPEETVVEQWVQEIRAAGKEALERVSHLADAPARLDAVVGRGETWDEALEDIEWDDGDVLVVGSSSIGPIARVFLGSRATKIVRHSPVPVVVVPREAAAEIAEEAESGGR
jgi:nucleotide-binding universal stress UspA family protein